MNSSFLVPLLCDDDKPVCPLLENVCTSHSELVSNNIFHFIKNDLKTTKITSGAESEIDDDRLASLL